MMGFLSPTAVASISSHSPFDMSAGFLAYGSTRECIVVTIAPCCVLYMFGLILTCLCPRSVSSSFSFCRLLITIQDG